MEELKTKQMQEITGGGFMWGLLAGIGAAIVFFIGALDGYTNPSKCHN